jgi:c-di-GMP-binding flagellar brake protein YcgR
MAILQAVLQKLSRKTPPATIDTPVNDLADRINRYAPLFALQEQKQFIEVVSESTGEVYQSMILAIDLMDGSMQLDELFPTPLHECKPGEHFTVRHHKRGQLLTFTTPLRSVHHGMDAPIYTLVLPEAVGYRQRRVYPRINLSQQQPLTVRVQSPWRTPWYATARNLSAGGMRITVGGNVMEQLHHGALLPLCEFEFGPEFKIRCQAKARSFRFIRRPYRHTEISIEFSDMAPAQRLQLQQFINSLTEPDNTGSPQAA